jgi:hypothetical protein
VKTHNFYAQNHIKIKIKTEVLEIRLQDYTCKINISRRKLKKFILKIWTPYSCYISGRGCVAMLKNSDTCSCLL